MNTNIKDENQMIFLNNRLNKFQSIFICVNLWIKAEDAFKFPFDEMFIGKLIERMDSNGEILKRLWAIPNLRTMSAIGWEINFIIISQKNKNFQTKYKKDIFTDVLI